MTARGGVIAASARRIVATPDVLHAALAVVVAAAAWSSTVGVTSGVDTSWQTALHLAVKEDLRAGHDWIYTYGPAGFLAYPTWFGAATGAASVILNLTARAAFLFVLLRLCRGRAPILLVAFGGYVLLIAWPFELPQMLVLVVMAVLTPVALRGERMPPLSLFGVAVVAGGLGTVKLNTAVLVGGAVVIIALRDRTREALTAAVAGGSVGFLAAWLLLGQRIGDIVGYFRSGLQVVSGYPEASSVEAPGVGWHYPAAFAIAVALIVAAWARRGDPKRSTLFVVAFFGWVGYNTARHAFVRHDAHALAFFSLACVVAIATAATQRGVRALLAAFTALAALVVGVQIRPLHGLRQPLKNAHQAAADVKSALLHSGERAGAHRAIARAVFDPNAAIITRSAGRGVHVEPNDAAIAFAYRQRWDPLPSFQQLLTYTPELDQHNVDRIESGAPEFVLMDLNAPAWDRRLPEFNAPKSRLALLCHYRQDAIAGQWALLRHNARSACGRPVVLARRHIRPNQTVKVPLARHGGVVLARFTLPSAIADTILELLWKPLDHPSPVVNGVTYRFLSAAAAGPFLLRVPPAAPFGPGATTPAIDTIALTGYDGSAAQVEFVEVPFVAPMS